MVRASPMRSRARAGVRAVCARDAPVPLPRAARRRRVHARRLAPARARENPRRAHARQPRRASLSTRVY